MFDNKEELTGIISPEDLLSHDQSAELNKLITIGANALYSEKLEAAAFVGHRDIDDSNIFHQYKVTTLKSEDGVIELDGVHTFFDDMKADGYIQDRRPTDMSSAGAIALILEGSRWSVGTVQSSHTGSGNFYYSTRLAAFWEFLEAWNVEFKLRMTYSDGRVTGRYVDIYDSLSDDYGKWFEYGDKLLKVSKTEDRQEIYTALLGRGKGEATDAGGYGRKINFADVVWTVAGGDPVDKPLGQEYVEIPSATEQYGYEGTKPRIGLVDFPEITDTTLLLEATYQEALEACRPLAQFSATALETGLAELGETVAIIRDDRNIRYKTRIFKSKRNYLDQQDKQFEFGDKITSSVGASNVQIKNTIKKQETQTISWLETVNTAMMSMFWNEDGYNYNFAADNEYGLPGGFYSFNAPIGLGPTKCIYMGAGMLAIANSKLPDGSWNFRTWGTGDGFTADLITTGILKAEIVQAGFNGIAQGITMTQEGLKAVDTSGDFSIVEKGGMGFYAVDGSKSGSIESGYYNSGEVAPGISLFIQDGKSFTITRKNPSGVYENILYLRQDEDFIRATKLSVGRLNITGTDQYLLNMQGGGGAYCDSEKVSLGIGSPETGVANIISVGADWIDMNAPTEFKYAVQIKNPASSYGGKIFDSANRLIIGGFDGTSIGWMSEAGGITPTARFGWQEIIAYGTLNMNGNAITNQSDIRLKSNVVDSEIDPFSIIEKMRFIEFDWDETNPYNDKKPEGRHFGIEAQYSPFLAVQDVGSNYLSIDMGKQVNLNSMALQKVVTEIKSIREENVTLKKELADLKQMLIDKGVI